MKAKTFFILALLLIVTQGVLAQVYNDYFGGGKGTETEPFLITNRTDWNYLRYNVSRGTTYSGQYFRLTDDITVGKMVGEPYSNGKGYYTFNGTFDGNGHTITVELNSEDDWCAPFAYTYGATIKNLVTEGTITTSGRYAGGVVGRNGTGNLTLTNVKSNIAITSTYSGEASHGGLVGYTINATLTGCAFTGKLLGSNSQRCGGLVGWKTSTSESSITLNSCVFAPSEITVSATNSHPFVVNNGEATFNNCYYRSAALGTDQGEQIYSICFADDYGISMIPTGTATDYTASGITAYDGNSALKYNGVVYAAHNDQVDINFSHNYEGCTIKYYNDQNFETHQLHGDDTDGYWFIMPGEDVIIYCDINAPSDLTGAGTEADPYIIGNEDDWNDFVGQINIGKENYATAYYRLTNDITVTTMAGSEGNRFKGHFDGSGHTLTFNYIPDEQYTAPFRYVQGATIENLHIDGTIYTSKKFAAGLIANSANGATIRNCRVSVIINSRVSGDGTHGGLVANNTSGTLNIEGCVFDGELLGSNTNNCAGFVGWNESKIGIYGAVNITNSLFAPAEITMALQHTFSRTRNLYAVTLQNCYSLYSLAETDNIQQVRAYSISAGSGVSIVYNGTPTTYNVSGLEAYNTGMKFGGVLYAKSGDELSLTLTMTAGAPVGDSFSTTAGELVNTSGDTYTLTMANSDAVINVDYSPVWSGSGTGEANDPYIISTTALWDNFASIVNSGKGAFASAYYKLGTDITVTTMAGSAAHPFKGHFDGGNHTLTFNCGTAEARFNEEYCAPFRYINGADISNLTVAGTIYTAQKFAAGIAGKAVGTNTITNCFSSITIDSDITGDGTHGGFVGIIDGGSTTITDCAFYGSLQGSTTNSCGGFVGWTNGSNAANFSGSLFAPASLTVNANGCATYSRGATPTLSGCYYTSALGAAQGTLVYATAPDGSPYTIRTLFGKDYYQPVEAGITDVTATDITPYSATISWTGSNGCSGYKVRYRKNNSYVEDGLPTGGTTIDANGDGSDGWTEIDNANPAGTAINGLEPLTTYEYQVVYNYEGGTYHTPSAILTTSDELSVPTDLSVSGITSNAADISWTGYTEKYNLRYRAYTKQTAQVTLNVPEDIWGDGSGYQMLLDANHNTYGSVIPESGPLTSSGDAPAGLYDNFEYKIPKDADGALTTKTIVLKNKVTIEIPAGIYDWCIVNPTPDDRIWIASENGNVNGRQNDFTFEPDKHYTFTVSDEGYDRVDMTVDTEYSDTEGSNTEEDGDAEWTKVNDITAPYAISNLQPSNLYQVQVQSVKGDRQSGWATIFFTTASEENIALLNIGDNSEIIAANAGKECNVTLSGRTLYKDGAWNTLTLPFDLALEGSPLEGATARPLTSASIEGTTLYLTFGDAVTELVAGTPYIIKWDKADGYDEASEDTRDIKNPVFNGVTIEATDRSYDNGASGDERVRFLGTYKSTTFNAEDMSILLMGGYNTLYYPSAGAGIGAQRAYFKIGDDTALPRQLTDFIIDFGADDDTIGIVNVEGDSSFFTPHSSLSGWYTLNGHKLQGKPTQRGVYMNNGRKVVIK